LIIVLSDFRRHLLNLHGEGLPSSSSHALVGALAGVVVVAVGADHVVWGHAELMDGHVKGVIKVVLGLLVSPVLGFLFAFVLHRFIRRQMNRASPKANAKLRHAQFGTAALLSFTHGANDAQKSMGILTLILVLGGFVSSFEVPWVILVCASAITFAVLGGWRIVKPSVSPSSRCVLARIRFLAGLGGHHLRCVRCRRSGIDHARRLYVDHGIGARSGQSHALGKAREIALT
jgi:hypothetical protein